MPVNVTPVAKPMAGIDFPVNHETFPNDCESVGCTKIEGWYRPRSWVLITNEYDKYKEENFKNDRNAANPRLGSPQHIKNITTKKDPGISLDQYKKKLAQEREHIQIEYEKTMEQREALQELYKQREEEYKTMKRFMEFLNDFYVPEMRYFIISTWIL
jgi:hypothetical protein